MLTFRFPVSVVKCCALAIKGNYSFLFGKPFDFAKLPNIHRHKQTLICTERGNFNQLCFWRKCYKALVAFNYYIATAPLFFRIGCNVKLNDPIQYVKELITFLIF